MLNSFLKSVRKYEMIYDILWMLGYCQKKGEDAKENVNLFIENRKFNVQNTVRDTVEALNIASATKAHVDTISVASPAACGPLSPSYNVEAKRVTLLPRPNRLQVQHCIRGRGPQISCHSSSLSGPCPLVFCSALAIFRASTVLI